MALNGRTLNGSVVITQAGDLISWYSRSAGFKRCRLSSLRSDQAPKNPSILRGHDPCATALAPLTSPAFSYLRYFRNSASARGITSHSRATCASDLTDQGHDDIIHHFVDIQTRQTVSTPLVFDTVCCLSSLCLEARLALST